MLAGFLDAVVAALSDGLHVAAVLEHIAENRRVVDQPEKEVFEPHLCLLFERLPSPTKLVGSSLG